MSKKFFVVGTLTMVAGTLAVLGVACSSSEDGATGDSAVLDASVPEADASKGKDSAVVGDEKVPDQEEGTVGATCTSNGDCTVADTINDNICSNEAFTDGDRFASPVCIQPTCTRGPGGSFEEMLCDNKIGFCLPSSSDSLEGTCLPLCLYSSTALLQACKGDNRCAFAHPGANADGAVAIGYCTGGCNVDADCKGTPGQKCQAETGLCVNDHNHVAFAKKLGDACDGSAASQVCSCAVGADPTKGVCAHACQVGTAGNDVCVAAAGDDADWKCTAKLPTTLTPSTGGTLPGFTGQPDGVVGSCALACPNGDADCAALSTKIGVTLTCAEFADGKYCDFP